MDGRKAAAMDEEEAHEAARKAAAEKIGISGLLYQIACLKQEIVYFDFNKLSATRGQHYSLERIEKLIRGLP